MNMKKIRTTAIAILLLYTAISHAQDIHFAQINETPLLLNPASAETGYDMRAILNYRDQWRSVTTPYKTFAASYEMKLKKKLGNSGHLGIGFFAFNDKAGTSSMSSTQFMLALSGIIDLNEKNSLSGGLAGGYSQRSVRTSLLRWDSQYNGSYDPSAATYENFADQSFGYADFNAGLQWNYGQGERYITANDEFKANAGFSVNHLTQPQLKYYGTGEKLYTRYTFHGGFIFGIKNTNVAIAPSFIYHRQGVQNEVLAGSMFKFKMAEDSKYTGFKRGASISFGTYYRFKDALVLISQFELGQYSLCFSYDVNTSGLTQASSGRGGFEVSLRFVSPNPYLFKSAPRM